MAAAARRVANVSASGGLFGGDDARDLAVSNGAIGFCEDSKPAPGDHRSILHEDVNSPPEDRSPLVAAYTWASRIITVSIEMVVPGLIGLWVDQKLGSKVVFTLLGFALGMTVGIWHLIRMTNSNSGDHESSNQGTRSR